MLLAEYCDPLKQHCSLFDHILELLQSKCVYIFEKDMAIYLYVMKRCVCVARMRRRSLLAAPAQASLPARHRVDARTASVASVAHSGEPVRAHRDVTVAADARADVRLLFAARGGCAER